MMLESRKVGVPVDNININKIIVSGEFPCIKKVSKYFFFFQNNEDVYTTVSFFPRMSRYLKNVNDAKTMFFLKR